MYTKKYSLAGITSQTVLASVVLLGTAAMSLPAQADGLYAGVNLGSVAMKNKTTNVNAACGTAGTVLSPGYTCSQDDKGNGAKLFGGYIFMENLSFELGYVDFGKATASASNGGVTASSKFEPKGFVFDVIGTLPITKEFALIGRVGIFRWNIDASASASNGAAISRQDTKPGFTPEDIGLGIQYSLNKTMDLRLEWERFKDVGNTLLTGQSDIDFTSLGLVYKF